MPTALRPLRLGSSRAHSDRKPAVEVQQCPLRAEGGEELGEELARRKWTWKWRKWTWKWMQRWWRRRRSRRRRTTLIKSNNPHLAGGGKRSKNSVKCNWHGFKMTLSFPKQVLVSGHQTPPPSQFHLGL